MKHLLEAVCSIILSCYANPDGTDKTTGSFVEALVSPPLNPLFWSFLFVCLFWIQPPDVPFPQMLQINKQINNGTKVPFSLMHRCAEACASCLQHAWRGNELWDVRREQGWHVDTLLNGDECVPRLTTGGANNGAKSQTGLWSSAPAALGSLADQ